MKLSSTISLSPVLVLLLGGCADTTDFTADDGTDESDSTGEDETSGVTPEMDTDTGGPVCGDGLVEGDETCDAGETGDANGPCTPECQLNVCGDGYLATDNFEACDDGNVSDDDACTSACELNVCGDGIIFYGVEGCDDGNDLDGDGCSTSCEHEAVTQLAVGTSHTCALLYNGAVRCWGDNSYGQLGYGHTESIGDDEQPAAAGDIDLGGVAIQVSAGWYHTCALLETGAVRCWGNNGVGQLGYPGSESVGDDEVPATAGDVVIGAAAVQITAGGGHTCALLETGNVRCWGWNQDGQLGYEHMNDIGDDENPMLAGDVDVGFHDAVQLSAGWAQTCAVLGNGAVRCWGNSDLGILGYGNLDNIGDDESPSSAGNVYLGAKATQVTTSVIHTCVRLDSGESRCWGAAALLGHPGQSESIGDDEDPTAVGTIDIGGGVREISAGLSHTCVVLDGGAVRCWGISAHGELGYGNTRTVGDDEQPSAMDPVQLGGTVTSIVTGQFHSCVLVVDGSVRCWGDNARGQLGLGNTENIGDDEVPTDVDPVRVF